MNHDPCEPGAESSPRSSSEIKKQLAELANVRACAEHYGAIDFASQIGMRSILLHEASLQAELGEAEQRESTSAIGETIERVLPDHRPTGKTLQGVLVGGNILKGRFQLQVGEKSFSGKTTKSATKALESIRLGDRVEAVVRKKKRRRGASPTSHKTSYVLTSIKNVSET